MIKTHLDQFIEEVRHNPGALTDCGCPHCGENGWWDGDPVVVDDRHSFIQPHCWRYHCGRCDRNWTMTWDFGSSGKTLPSGRRPFVVKE